MDTDNANFSATVNNLKKKFSANFVPLVIPIGKAANFSGVLNLVTNETLIHGGEKESTGDLSNELTNQRQDYYQGLLESLADTDDALMEKFFAEESFSKNEACEWVIEEPSLLIC